MKTVSAARARRSLGRWIAAISASKEPIAIPGRRGRAVLIPETAWREIEETLYLLSAPGIADSIRSAMRQPLSKATATLRW